MSQLGPACVKTRLGEGCAELFSQLPSSERSCQYNRLPHRRNRDGSSTRKLETGVFTQPGSKAEKLNGSIRFPLCPQERTLLRTTASRHEQPFAYYDQALLMTRHPPVARVGPSIGCGEGFGPRLGIFLQRSVAGPQGRLNVLHRYSTTSRGRSLEFCRLTPKWGPL